MLEFSTLSESRCRGGSVTVRRVAWLRRAGALIVALVLSGASPAWGEAEDELRFLRDGREIARIEKPALRDDCPLTELRVPRDPYYQVPKRYWVCPLETVLRRGFGLDREALRRESFFLRAADGYVRTAEGAQLLEGGAFLALADADETPKVSGETFEARWLPIDRRGIDPGPYYLVWSGAGQGDPHRYPWPFQLIEIEIAPFDRDFAHTVPRGVEAGGPAWRGFATFRRECLSCHSINGEGGKVGPDLNIPKSIVEYRPAQQIKAYIRNPRSFRYTTMPAHLHLSDSDLEDLVAYFSAMSARKFDATQESAP